MNESMNPNSAGQTPLTETKDVYTTPAVPVVEAVPVTPDYRELSEDPKEKQASTLLLVAGILHCIGGAFVILVSLLVLALGPIVAQLFGDQLPAPLHTFIGGAAFIAALVLWIVAAWKLFIGITALRNRKGNSKVKLLFVLGVIEIVFAALSLVTTLASHTFGFSSLIALIAPICYFVGALFKKKLYSRS